MRNSWIQELSRSHAKKAGWGRGVIHRTNKNKSYTSGGRGNHGGINVGGVEGGGEDVLFDPN